MAQLKNKYVHFDVYVRVNSVIFRYVLSVYSCTYV